MAYIKMYFASDDSEVSQLGTFVNSIDFTLRADLEESEEVRLYVLADSGFQVTDTEIIPSGTSAARWKLAPDSAGSSGTYGAGAAKIELGTVGPSNKVYFWAQAEALDTEDPVNDTSVSLEVSGIAEAL